MYDLARARISFLHADPKLFKNKVVISVTPVNISYW